MGRRCLASVVVVIAPCRCGRGLNAAEFSFILAVIVEVVVGYWEAGFTDIALVQIGDEGQNPFLKEAATPLLAALRTAAG
jgi:hypothetical protein